MRIFILISLLFFSISSLFTQGISKERTSRNVDVHVGDFDHEKINQSEEYKEPILISNHGFAPVDINYIKEKSSQLEASNFQERLPRFIEGRMKNNDPDLIKSIYRYLENAAPLMKLDPGKEGFEVVGIWEDDLKHTHVKMQQKYQGTDIYGGEIILHSDAKGPFALNGNYYSNTDFQDLDASFLLKEEDIKNIVKENLNNYQEAFLNTKTKSIFSQLKQWEINPVIVDLENRLVSAFHVLVYANLGEYYTFFIDGKNGVILRSYSNICKFHGNHEDCSHKHHRPVDGPAVATAIDLLGETRTIDTWESSGSYYMADGSRPMFQSNSPMPNDGVGIILTIDAFDTAPQNSDFSYDHFVSNNNSWSTSPEAVSAHFNGGQAYEYYKNVHNRESISGNGQNIYSFVNVAGEDGNSMGNAFWNGAAIFYGNGDSAFKPLGRALDVAGHEMTHGVVQVTANLDYFSESGAMNESFADIFGSMMDRDDWLIGEDVVNTSVFSSGALRNMQDPHNGQAFQDYGKGWQPSHVNEQFTGSQDNGGVHINSGIPNRAYYLFATNSAVGKERAEKVFYRALTTYLTRSSNFKDLKVAVAKSADDLYDNSVVNAANAAFDGVGIGGSGGQTDYEEDVDVNPGSDFLLFSNSDLTQLFIKDIASGNIIANPLSQTPHISRPSVADDGEEIVFVNSDNQIVLIRVDWQALSTEEILWDNRQIWDRIVISKDGRRLAGLSSNIDNTIFIYDDVIGGDFVEFELYNPTFSEGVTTGEVLYADAMEFDITGDFIVYDAINRISSSNSGEIEYWDIGFINVWNSSDDTWALGNISKLFTSIPEGSNVGNPTFSKNSPYILALDFFTDTDYKILGVNVESGEVGEMFINSGLSWPSYSRDDTKMVYDLPGFFGTDVGDLGVGSDKISTVTNSEGILQADGQWGVWFSNGQRDLMTDVFDFEEALHTFEVFPNPVNEMLNIEIDLAGASDVMIEILDMEGRILFSKLEPGHIGKNNFGLPVKHLKAARYLLKLSWKDQRLVQGFVKI